MMEIGNYRTIKELDTGGSGCVYLATHSILDTRLVAVKMLHDHLVNQPEQAQFLQEARFLERLNHHGILTIYDVGFHQSVPYIVTEYAPGGSLRDLLDLNPGRPLPLQKALSIVIQVGEALQYAHDQGIVHRDLKPENILFAADGSALLADFGIAREADITYEQTIIGTVAYMAPEQFQGVVSRKGDQYALGCVTYELMTGRVPLVASDKVAQIRMQQTVLPLPPSTYNPTLLAPLDQAILKALAKQRSGRYATVREYLAAFHSPYQVYQSAALPSQDSLQAQVLLDEGDNQLAHGHPKKALTSFERALLLLPNHPGASLAKGKALFALHHYKKALEPFEQVLQRDLGNLDALRFKGEALTHLKRFMDALNTYDEALALYPTDASLHYQRGRLLEILKRHRDALEAFGHACSLDPGKALYFFEQGMSFITLRQINQAIRAFTQAVELSPNTAKYRDQLLRGLASRRKHQEEVIEFCTRLCARTDLTDQSRAAFLLYKGNAYSRLKQYHEALTAYSQILHLFPKDQDALANKGHTLYALAWYNEALLTYQYLLQEWEWKYRSDESIFLTMGHCQMEIRQYEDALVSYTKAVSVNPVCVAAHEGRGMALQLLDQYDGALSSYLKVLALKPFDPLMLLAKATCLIHLQRYPEALETYERVLDQDPHSPQAIEGKRNVIHLLNQQKPWSLTKNLREFFRFLE